MEQTALIYCEGNFGKIDGKTANGLIRHSKKYQIKGIIDRTKAGQDSGKVLDKADNGILIYFDLKEAIRELNKTPKYFIYGIAPKEAFLSTVERRVILDAMALGMDIVNGLHEFISEDKEFMQAAKKYHVHIEDIRKPMPKRYLHLFSGDIMNVTIPRVAIFGTDCAVGKRTTAMFLVEALKAKGINALFIGSGQTGIIQGEKYGIAMDAMPSEFMAGEFEHVVMEGIIHEKPDIIIIEGQSALSHPAFVSTCAIIRGSRPNAIIIQHPPKRKERTDFPGFLIPEVSEEIDLLENFSKAKVVAITINHEDMTAAEVDSAISDYEEKYEIPADDILLYGCNKLVETLCKKFPELEAKIK